MSTYQRIGHSGLGVDIVCVGQRRGLTAQEQKSRGPGIPSGADPNDIDGPFFLGSEKSEDMAHGNPF